jgi:dTDP-4-amino-4,6-dideoxygalactose transaminase
MIVTASHKVVPFHRAFVGDEEIEAVAEVLRSGWLTTGPKVQEFESAFAHAVEARHALAVSSCTAALHLALEAIGLEPGDEVLLPTLTFTATAEVVAYFKAKPVLVDSEAQQFNLDPAQLQRHLTSRTRAIIPVHFAGHPCAMNAIQSFAAANRLVVIEDAAHAFPAKYDGKPVGSLSALTAFSFYATKTITTGEGGMITTDNDELAGRMAIMRLHGMSRDAWKRYSAQGSWSYDVVAPGFKYNLTDLQGALGLVQLRKAERMRERRAELALRYSAGLGSCPAFRPLAVAPHIEHAWHLFVVLLQPGTLRISRDQVIEELKQQGVGTAVHFIPLHRHSYYRNQWGYGPEQFPVAEDYFQRCISLPLYPGMSDADSVCVLEALHDIAARFRR